MWDQAVNIVMFFTDANQFQALMQCSDILVQWYFSK